MERNLKGLKMLNFAQIKKTVIAQKIKTPEQLNQIWSTRQAPIKIFGITLLPKYQLDQDVFTAATKNKKSLHIPARIKMIFTGKGSCLTDLKIGEGAIFKAPSATFGDTVSAAKKAVVRTVRNLASIAGHTEVKTVTGHNIATKAAEQKIGTVYKNNESKQKAVQIIDEIQGNNRAEGNSQQILGHVLHNNIGFDNSSQLIYQVRGKNEAHGRASQRILSSNAPTNIYENAL